MALSIAIVGAGFTGNLLAVHILRNATSPMSVQLIEKRGAFGRGVAYSTKSASHLLNVRASNMSAFPDQPEHFVEWLRQRDDRAVPASSIPASGHAFVPRRLYGNYLEDQLTTAVRRAASHAVFGRGLLPARHSEARRYCHFVAGRPLLKRALEAFRLVRAEVRAAADQGYNWRSVLDAPRSHTQHIWQALSLDERRRFLRHLRPYWEVHRHRMAPGVAGRITAALDHGQLKILAGRLRTIQVKSGRLSIAYAPRGSESIAIISPNFPSAGVRFCAHLASSDAVASRPRPGSSRPPGPRH